MNLAPPVKNMKWALYQLGDITQWYGENEELYTNGLKDDYPEYYAIAGMFKHTGVDIVRNFGERLYAVDDGIITHAKDETSGYGRHLRLRTKFDDELDIDWVYGHNSYNIAKKGDFVKKGELIALMGNSGFVISGGTPYWGNAPDSKGVHLHFAGRFMDGSTALDYYNGAFGRFDPLPLFMPPELLSSKVVHVASEIQNKTVYQLGMVLKAIGQ